jgi:eukaryotic-like serine/threonine-protein kinase
MQNTATSAMPIDRDELPSMFATLCSYESIFGPYHPQTLRLMTQVAIAYWHAEEADSARPLLERAVRDVGRCLGRDHEMRLRAMVALRDLFIAQSDYEQAGTVQRELLECQTLRLGSDHPETLAIRSTFEALLLERVTCDSNQKV